MCTVSLQKTKEDIEVSLINLTVKDGTQMVTIWYLGYLNSYTGVDEEL